MSEYDFRGERDEDDELLADEEIGDFIGSEEEERW